MKIARVFPRRTKATPSDPLAFVEILPLLSMEDIDEVHVSIAFTYDIPDGEFKAEQLIDKGFKVKVGGPAYGKPAGEFNPKMYMKAGYTITSRGCPNNCWFCRVPKTQGKLIELPIQKGWHIQDDNLLASSEQHIRAVFEMLKQQRKRPVFSGGLEAKILKPWHVDLLLEANPQEMFFAYDTPDDYEPLVQAGKMFAEVGFDLKSRKKFAYVLIGYPKDTFEQAEKRLMDTLKAGFIPFAMLYKDEDGNEDTRWRKFQRPWARPAIIVSNHREYFE
jgi:hypothetical protein